MKLIFAADRDLRSARPDDRIVMERFVLGAYFVDRDLMRTCRLDL